MHKVFPTVQNGYVYFWPCKKLLTVWPHMPKRFSKVKCKSVVVCDIVSSQVINQFVSNQSVCSIELEINIAGIQLVDTFMLSPGLLFCFSTFSFVPNRHNL